MSLDGIVELYEAAVDEEKVATFGMGLGMARDQWVWLQGVWYDE